MFSRWSNLEKLSPTRAGSYCQRKSYRKWAVLCKIQVSIFHPKSAENAGRKFAEYQTNLFVILL
jgi:hypothetical protein